MRGHAVSLMFAVVAVVAAGATHGQAPASGPIEATTATGEKVRLLPNGRWEYVDQKKQDEAKKVADTYPENKPAAAPPPTAAAPAPAASAGTQGGLFGIGRTVQPGDKDYNRGSLSGKGR